MTGQVKEDIISRFGELGLVVKDGCLQIKPRLLQDAEFITAPATFRYIDIRGTAQHMPVPSGGLAFTFCQVPFCYQRGAGRQGIEIARKDGAKENVSSYALDRAQSADLFGRTGKISSVTVFL
jgi:hypothetical protein